MYGTLSCQPIPSRCNNYTSYGFRSINPVFSREILFASQTSQSPLLTCGYDRADEQTKGVSEETSMVTLERRQMLMNTEATVDNNFELFEAQRIEDLKVLLTAIGIVNGAISPPTTCLFGVSITFTKLSNKL